MPTSEVAGRSDPGSSGPRGCRSAELPSIRASSPGFTEPGAPSPARLVCRPRPAVSSTKSLLRTKSVKSRQPEAPLAREGRQPLTAAPPWEGLLLLEEKTSSKTRIRKKEKRSKLERGAGCSRAGPGSAREAAQEPGSISEVRTGGFRPLGSFEVNRRPRVSPQTLQTRAIPGSGPPLSPRPPGAPYSLCGDGS